jgi:hypothetical protein
VGITLTITEISEKMLLYNRTPKKLPIILEIQPHYLLPIIYQSINASPNSHAKGSKLKNVDIIMNHQDKMAGRGTCLSLSVPRQLRHDVLDLSSRVTTTGRLSWWPWWPLGRISLGVLSLA